MNRLDISLHAIRHGRIGGVESAVYNLVRGLHDCGQPLLLTCGDVGHLSPEFLAWSKRAGLHPQESTAFGSRISARFLEEMAFSLVQNSDTVLYPNYFLPPMSRRNVKKAVIIHDYQYRFIPENFSRNKRLWLEANYRHTLKHADHVFFISEYEMSQAARFHGDAWMDRASVVYNAIDWSRYDGAPPSTSSLERPYILSVAHQHQHKNVEKLIQAMALPHGPCSDLDLVLVGTPSPRVKMAADALLGDRRNRVIFTGFVSDAVLGSLYRNAAAFALASYYEGFGMPAVEAMGFGLNTVVSNSTALPDVTLQLADYVSPEAPPEEWAEHLSVAARACAPPEAIASSIRARYAPVNVARRVLDALN
jgi:glycosyltransferase involved in cell wall biosynthesis